jgi:transcriptional regulator with XRE-family HTH domain
MGRETEDERADRLRRAGRWLRKERDSRRIRARDVYERLGVAQQTYSQYERGHLQIPYEFTEPIAEVLGMDEPAVWRGLEMPLPPEFRTDESLRDYVQRTQPARFDVAYRAAMAVANGAKSDAPPVSPKRRTRKSERQADTPENAENAV